MPGPILHAQATASCPHGGRLTIVPSGSRVLADGSPIAILTDQGQVVGCAFAVGTKPQPCVSTQWLAGATRVTSMGTPVLINPPAALCLSADQIPGGPPVITATQTRVVAM
ncbi:hypothetical protein ACFCVO_00195 [Agromyces sp. NPDC056379]|uniref:hypothetical protein n=1 Tax=unclassified Agromyces TaxID=2639701 RepID=UPI0035D55160